MRGIHIQFMRMFRLLQAGRFSPPLQVGECSVCHCLVPADSRMQHERSHNDDQ